MNAFRGFYTLFWIMLGVGGIRTVIRSYEDDGILLGLEFGRFIGEDALNLAMSDAILVGVTILCVPFIKVVFPGFLFLLNAPTTDLAFHEQSLLRADG
jgi:sterol O-acyltransferase